MSDRNHGDIQAQSESSDQNAASAGDSPPSLLRSRFSGKRAGGLGALRAFLEWLFSRLAELSLSRTVRGLVRRRPWQLRIAPRGLRVAPRQSDVDRLLQRHRDLQDMEKLAATAASFRLPESDFFADPRNIERLIRRFLEENPPWLRVGGYLAESGANTGDAEVVYRERVTRRIEDTTLFIPDDTWRDKPLASLTMRPARHLSELRQTSLLSQILPPEVQMDRLSRGELLVPVHHRMRQRLEFRSEQRPLETVRVQRIPVIVDAEGGSGTTGQLLYILLDFSASMRGKAATLALAALATVLRANLGRADARYLFRRFAQEEDLWPAEVEPPVQARSVQEKDALLDTLLATNFNGGATHVNHALNIAAQDIENLRRDEDLDATLLLVTDGRAELLASTRDRLHAAHIKIHTIMVTPEPNPDLEKLSDSFTVLDIAPDGLVDHTPLPVSVAVLQPRRAYRI